MLSFLLGLAVLIPVAVTTDVTLSGSDSQANQVAEGRQTNPVATAVAGGGFVAAWESGDQIASRRFTAAGSPLGSEEILDTGSLSSKRPALASLGADGYVATWDAVRDATSELEVFAAVLNAEDGSLAVPQFLVSGDNAGNPSVAATGDGRFFLLFLRSGKTLLAKVYRNDGEVSVPEYPVLDESADVVLKNPSVVLLAPGRLLLIWEDHKQGGGVKGSYVTFQGGQPQHTHFTIDESRENANVDLDPKVSPSVGGSFVVVWTGSDGVKARQYAADGTEGPILEVSAGLRDRGASVATLRSGAFVVLYEMLGDGVDVSARVYSADGIPEGVSFVLPQETSNTQLFPYITSLPAGPVALWMSNHMNANQDIYMTLFLDNTVAPCTTAEVAADGSSLQGVRLASSVSHFRDFSLHDIPEAVVNGKDATAWFPPLPMPEGTALEVSCCGKEACDVFVSIFHCPPCSGDKNGGYPALLPTEGFVARSCAPKFTERDDFVNGWENERHRMVTFHRRLVPGEVFTLPKTIKPTSHVVVFTTSAPVADDWCPGVIKGCGGPCPSASALCSGRFCL